MKGVQKKGKNSGILKYLIAFLIPVFLFGIILWKQQAYPFGSNSFLYGDAYYQYYAMFQELIDWLHNGEGSMILWNRGLGVDFFSNMFYYCMSPFNIIIIAMGENHIALSMVIVIIVKLAAMCVTALYYFEHTSLVANRRSHLVIRYGISYAYALSYVLCGYVLAYNHNLMWLDGLMILPLLAIAIEKMSTEGKSLMYYILLILTFVTNFYFAFYICIFAVIYFLILDRENIRQFIRRGLLFAGTSILAAFTSACVLLPAIFAIRNVSSVGSENNIGMFSVGNLCDFLESFYPLRYLDADGVSIFTHNNFCGSVIFILIVFFFLGKEISLKRKIKFAASIIILIASLNISGLNYVFHGFSFTHGMGNRFAFILLFILIVIAFQILSESEMTLTIKTGLGVVGIFVLFSISLVLNQDKGNPYSYIIFLMLMTIYTALLIFKWRKSIQADTFFLWIVGLFMLELIANAVMTASDKYESGSLEQKIQLSEWEDEYDRLMCEVGERKSALYEEIYMEKSDVNWYSSLNDKSMIESFRSMGMSHYQNIEYTYRGTTRLTALMYNVRYVLTNEKGILAGYHSISEQNGYTIYEADVLAGMGFMLDADIKNWETTDSAADNQNTFVKAAFGGEQLFEEVKIDHADITYENMEIFSENGMNFEYEGKGFLVPLVIINFQADADMDLYMESSDTSLQAITVTVNEEIRVDTIHVESESLLHIGDVHEGDEISILHFSCATDGDLAKKSIQLYAFDNEAFEEILPNVLDETLSVESIEGNTMQCNISAKKDGVLYIALPYHQGYTIFVDGTEQNPIKIGMGFMGVELSSGDHRISICYETPGYRLGMIITILSFLLSVAIFITVHKRNVLQQDER